jgi:hypothetical protein
MYSSKVNVVASVFETQNIFESFVYQSTKKNHKKNNNEKYLNTKLIN